MTVLLFRKQVETILFGLVGEYTLSPGVTTPAVRFREGDEQLDENIAVSGLEVVLEISEPIRNRNLYSGTPLQVRYNIRLTQWSGSEYDDAVQRLLFAYPDCSIFPIRPPAGLGPTKQCLIEVPSSTFSVGQYIVKAP